ncbi:hypothetical protein [Amycolatopsis minnesotensis]|uniref:3-hydroxyacyl-ACP dehydratase FabZ n=1 Tax=Amycolatopsis minnesotensis TaxID=337894 RepID=A0ABP5BXZ8_9PSEU
MTAGATARWHEVPAPAFAAPLAAVDRWRAEEDGPRTRVDARLLVRGDDPNLAGHFPGFPILPGVFLLESLDQTVRAVFRVMFGAGVGLREVTRMRFVAPVLPGGELRWDIRLEPEGDEGVTASAKAYRGGGDAVAATFLAVFGRDSDA